MIKKKFNNLLKRFPFVKKLYLENFEYKRNCCFPPGHYYSTIVNVDEIKEHQEKIWANKSTDGIVGINLNTKAQLDTVKSFHQYYKELPFPDIKNDSCRYYFENGYYSYTDAVFLYSMIRQNNPKKIIEIGSGFSSSLMLDTNERFMNNSMELTFIEPYAERLHSLLKEEDYKSTKVIGKRVQDVSIEEFKTLNSGDFLFVDSTHVVKTGSDVNYIISEILPQLKSGVFIHFHDIFYPFEYPREWVFNGRNWNEDYFVKAFLMYNNSFEIKLFSHYLHEHHRNIFEKIPICYKQHGGNLWIKKID